MHHKVALCASAYPAKIIPELCNRTLNQLKFNLQEHPDVTNMLEKPHSSIRLLCFYRWKREFVCRPSGTEKSHCADKSDPAVIACSTPHTSVTSWFCVKWFFTSWSFQHMLLSPARWDPCTRGREQHWKGRLAGTVGCHSGIALLFWYQYWAKRQVLLCVCTLLKC